MSYFTAFVVIVIALYGAVLTKTVVSSDGENGNSSVRRYDVVVEAARGEILDRNGATLVSNRQGNSIEFNAALFPSKQADRNRIIAALIELCESKNEEWKDNLPIIFDETGTLVFEEERSTDIKSLKNKNMLNLNSYATAENCLDALIESDSVQGETITVKLVLNSVVGRELKVISEIIAEDYVVHE